MDFHNDYQGANGQLLENEEIIQTKFFYDSRFSGDVEIKNHCKNCFCDVSCCCSISLQKISAHYKEELQQMTSEYEQIFLKVKLEQLLHTPAFKDLNEGLSANHQPFEAYQPIKLPTSDYPSIYESKLYTSIPTYNQLNQNRNHTVEQPSQDGSLEKQIYNPAVLEYQQSSQKNLLLVHQEVNHKQSAQYSAPVYQPFNQQQTSAYQFKQITTSASEQIILQTHYNQHHIQSVEQPPIYHKNNQNNTQQFIIQNENLLTPAENHVRKRTPAYLRYKRNEKVNIVDFLDLTNTDDQNTNINAQAAPISFISSQESFSNKIRKRTLDVQDTLPAPKIAKISIFHSIYNMSQSSSTTR